MLALTAAASTESRPAGERSTRMSLESGAADGREALQAALAPSASRLDAAREPTREERLSELKRFLERKETELAALAASKTEVMREMEAVLQQVDALKRDPNRGAGGQRTLERLLARLRPRADEGQRLDARLRDVREEAFAASAAIVTELESLMEETLIRFRESPDPDAHRRLAERLIALERERRSFQARMNDLMPDIPPPAEIPASATWTAEMVEDQLRGYEAAIARLQAQRAQVEQELRLRRRLREAVPDAVPEEPATVESRLVARAEDLDRKVRLYKAKFDRLSAQRPKER